MQHKIENRWLSLILFFAGPGFAAAPGWENTGRVELEIEQRSANSGFSANRKKEEFGLSSQASILKIELLYPVYGNLLLGFSLPYYLSNQNGLNGQKFKNSNFYKQGYDRAEAAVYPILKDEGICASRSDCSAQVMSGQVLPIDRIVTLPSGESFTIKAGVPVKSYLDSVAYAPYVGGAGETGIGDLSLDSWYLLHKDDRSLIAGGLAVEFPTGKFSEVAVGRSPTGGGVTDVHASVFGRYRSEANLEISSLVAIIVSVASGKKSKSSLLTSGSLNKEDPNTPAAVLAGSSSVGNSVEYSRPGLGSNGYFNAIYGLSAFKQELKGLAVLGALNYDIERAREMAAESIEKSGYQVSMGCGMSYAAVFFEIPTEIQMRMTTPVFGKNISQARDEVFLSLNTIIP
jgi:hypothetical protein